MLDERFLSPILSCHVGGGWTRNLTDTNLQAKEGFLVLYMYIYIYIYTFIKEEVQSAGSRDEQECGGE